MIKNLLVADPFDEDIIRNNKLYTENKNYNLTYLPKASHEEIEKELIKGYSALIVKNQIVSSSMLKKWKLSTPNNNLCIIKAGADSSHIDFESALELGIPIMNLPNASNEILSNYILKHLPADGNKRNVAIIGYGTIGQYITPKILERNFNIKVFSPRIQQKKITHNKIIPTSNLAECLIKADFVIILIPLITKQQSYKVNQICKTNILTPSLGIIGEDELNLINSNTVIICPSRPWVFNLEILENKISSGIIKHLYFNANQLDIELLKTTKTSLFAELSEKCSFEKSALCVNSNSQAYKEFSRFITIQALNKASNFCNYNIISDPIFVIKDWEIFNANKTKICFIGSKVNNIISILELLLNPNFDIFFPNSQIIILEEPFNNLENYSISNLAIALSLPLSKPGNQNRLNELFPKGWILKTNSEKDLWKENFLKYCNKPFEDWLNRANIITKLSKTSIKKWIKIKQEFMEELNELDFIDNSLIHIYLNELSLENDYKFLSQADNSITKMDYNDLIKFDPNFKNSKLNIIGAIIQPGKQLNFNNIKILLTNILEKEYGVRFYYNLKAKEIRTNKNTITHIVTDIGDIEVDQVIISNYSSLDLFQDCKISPSINYIGAPTLNVGCSMNDLPFYSLKLKTEDGIITFSPLKESQKLIVEGLFFKINKDEELNNKAFKYLIEKLKFHLKKLFPIIYENALKQEKAGKINAFEEALRYQQITDSGLPLIEQYHHDNLYLSIGDDIYAPGCAQILSQTIFNNIMLMRNKKI